ncbi:MAG: response regulator [Candidatus Aminicenantes bacterium]|nr:MAG: response regulator [Candidatus Aminicenantes bacterium]
MIRENKIFLLLVLFLALAGLQNLYTHGEDIGLKYYRNFSPRDYDHQPQNWSIAQDKRGIIYVGNNGGLLEFDGVSWRLIYVPNWIVRSLDVDSSGTLYMGGDAEFGFWTHQPNGAVEYTSLVPLLPENQRNFSDVWRTHCTHRGVYFSAHEYLFHWNPRSKQLKVWKPGTRFNAVFSCAGKIFIRQEDIGLMQMKESSPQLVPGGKLFAAEKIFMMVSYDNQRLLVGTRSKGFYLYDGAAWEPFPTEVDDYLKKNRLYNGIRLANGDFAMATLQGGLVVMDARGALKYSFNQDNGLQNNNVNNVFQDSRQNLWLALNEGITRIEYASPISLYDKRSGLKGIVLSVVKHRGTLYAGTTSGLYIFDRSLKKFLSTAGISRYCWDLLPDKNSLLAATSAGLFQIQPGTAHKILEKRSYALLRSRRDPHRIWVGTRRGLVSIYYQPNTNQWTTEHQFENITLPILYITQDQPGNLWLGTKSKGVLKVNIPGALIRRSPKVNYYHTSHGLPPGEIGVFWAAGHVIATTKEGIFRFHELKQTFIPDTTLGQEFAGGATAVFRIAEDKNKNIWFHSKSMNIQAIFQPGGNYTLNKKPFLRIPLAQVNMIYPDPEGESVWFAGIDNLLCYHTRAKKIHDPGFSTLIREVVIDGNPLVYDAGEYKYKEYKENKNSQSPMPVIDYKHRNLRFRFAAPFFEAEDQTAYQFLLGGYDDRWSDWTPETQKDYTNIDPGKYTFRVRARNVYGQQGREAVFHFKILPPWYRTWWAYSFYALTALLMVYLIVQWRSRKLELEKQKLEQLVQDRTREINEKNWQLETQTLQLKEQSGKLQEMDRVKSRFFANISHEFRTPLTLITGPLEQILEQTRDNSQKKIFSVMLRNSRRLLTLINQLLDLSRFDSGKMKLQAAHQDMIPFVKSILESFHLLARQNKLDIRLKTGEETIFLYFDTQKMEEVLTNLLDNAVKFTPASGTITVSVTRHPSPEDHFPSGFLRISVRDTGIGIPKDQLIHIFDRFYRVEDAHPGKQEQKGTGIGLALTKEVIALHRGKIDVHSREGENSGTEFVVRLPLGQEHLEPGDMITPSQIPAPGQTDAGIQPDDEPREHERESLLEPAPDTGEAEPGKPVILVVEDHADVRDYIRGSLQSLYTIAEAADGKEGIEKAKEIIPDLVISDVMMPETDGYQLCRTLKKDILTSHIPIILLTAKVSEENVLQGLETGADDYIPKPFNMKLLLTRVKNLIELRRHLQVRRKSQMDLQPGEIVVSPLDEDFYNELQEVIEKNLADPDFNVEQLGKKLYMGRTTLYRKILAITGETPYQFIRSYRLLRAARLLETRSVNVSEAALKVGFTDMSYFARCFKEKFHQLPSQFQAAGSELPWPHTGAEAEKTIAEAPGTETDVHIRDEEVILIVEDNDDARDYIRDALEPLYQVQEAVNGKQGIETAGQIIPDLIISDVMMPEKDGYELCRELKTDIKTSHIPIMLLTAKASEESVIRGLETGADDYITKPFNTAILKARIRNLIDLRRRLQLQRKRRLTLLPTEIPASSLDETFYQEVQDMIEENLSDPDFNVEVLSQKLVMGRSTLYRKILALTGETPTQWIRSYRLKRAAELLKAGTGNVTEVAFEVGFSSSPYFTRCFKEKFHRLPSTYQASESEP